LSEYTAKIKSYGMGVNDFKTSPFEALNMLHTRSYLEKVLPELSNEEKIQLYFYDMNLIFNAKKMIEHVKEIYDFSQSKEPLNEWWWHLDKVADGKIPFRLSADVDSDMVI